MRARKKEKGQKRERKKQGEGQQEKIKNTNERRVKRDARKWEIAKSEKKDERLVTKKGTGTD